MPCDSEPQDARRPSLAVTLARGGKHDALALATPLLVAAGTAGGGAEFARVADLSRVGAFVTSAVSFVARGVPLSDQLRDTPAGVLVPHGPRTLSVHAIERRHAPIWRTWRLPVLINLRADDPDDCARVAARLGESGDVAGFELDLSPLGVGGAPPEVAAVRRALRAVKRATPLPLLVKLADRATAQLAADDGADAVVVGGSVRGATMDIGGRRAVLGELSGPAIRPLVLRAVLEVAAVVRVPVLASGGVATWQDAVAYLLAGASAVQVGVGLWRDPGLGRTLASGIEAYLVAEGAADVNALIGAARPRAE